MRLPEPNTAPGPRGDPLIGNVRAFARDPFQFLLSSHQQYGDIVRFHFGPLSAYLFAHPDSVQYVFRDNVRNYRKTIGYDRMKPLLGNGLLVSEGEPWLRRRRLFQPSFQHHQLAALTTPITEAVAARLKDWQRFAEASEPLDVVAEMTQLTRAIIGRVLFGKDLTDRASPLGQALAVAQQLSDDFTRQLTRDPLAILAGLGLIPQPRPRRVRVQLHALDGVLYDVIAQCRREEVNRGDLLSLMLTAPATPTGERMTDQQVRDELVTIFLAGNETPAVALAWTWYLLSLHPEVERRLDAEIVQVLGGRVPTWDDLPNLQYTMTVLHESLRLYPPAWLIPRTVMSDDAVGGYRIPAKSLALLSPYVTHRHPALWDNPNQFAPERFASERTTRPHFAYFPFGGGPRQCLGNHLAMVEMQLALAMIAQQYRLSLVAGQRIEPEVMIALRPRYGMWMCLEKK